MEDYTSSVDSSIAIPTDLTTCCLVIHRHASDLSGLEPREVTGLAEVVYDLRHCLPPIGCAEEYWLCWSVYASRLMALDIGATRPRLEDGIFRALLALYSDRAVARAIQEGRLP